MRIPRALSPSALQKFEKNIDQYYLTYLAEVRTQREPQSKPASVGSAFDAFIKAELIDVFFGEKNEFESLFESQVEEQNRDFALEAGRHILSDYKYCGAYKDLLELMDGCENPRFEFDGSGSVGGVPIYGKPDCCFESHGVGVVLDWKVNGYCGNSGTSPAKGYALVRDGEGWTSRNNGQSHKLYNPLSFKGFTINEYPMEETGIDWADQTTMYSWMGGCPVGQESVVMIDQVVAKPGPERPLLRIAQHRARVSSDYQLKLLARLQNMWQKVNSGQVFDDDPEINQDRVDKLNKTALSMQTDNSDLGNFFAYCSTPITFYRGR